MKPKTYTKDYGILLVNPLPYSDYSLSESLGIEYLNSILQAAGYPSRVLVDRSCELSFERMLAEIRGVRFLGYTLYSESVDYVFGMVARLKSVRPNIHVSIGGPLSCFCAEEILTDCEHIDSVVVGEGYETILELVESLHFDQSLTGCAGLCYRESNGEISWTPSRKAKVDIDTLPFPTRTMLEKDNGVLVAYLTGSTGCVGQCIFCVESAVFKQILGANADVKRIRYRSIDQIVCELTSVMTGTNFDTFEMVDSSFEGYGEFGRRRLEEFADRIIEEKLPCYLVCNFRAESFRSEHCNLLKKLTKAGVCLAFVGVESGYNPTLEYFRKRARVTDNLQVLRLLREHNIPTEIGFIMFHPRTTFTELRENVVFLAEAGFAWNVDLYVSKLALYPGTPIVKEMLAESTLLKPTFSYRRPYDYDFSDPNVGGLVSYLEQASPNRNLALDVSIPILQTQMLICKTRLFHEASNACEEWTYKIDHAKQELGSCNLRWFTTCIDCAEHSLSDLEAMNQANEVRINEIEKRGIGHRVRQIDREIRLYLSECKVPYIIRTAPWGEVIYPARIYDR